MERAPSGRGGGGGGGLRAFRITRRPFQALDGEGARLVGGRWNSEGVPVIYAASTLALAALEYLVHIDVAEVPADLVAMTIEIPGAAPVERVRLAGLPSDWNQVPGHPACVAAGDAWARRGRALVLRVPSAIVPDEDNLLINPRHPDAARVRVTAVRAFAFDPRLL